MIAVTAELRAKEGREADLEKRMRQLADRVRHAEPGCRLYVFARSQHDPRLYVTLERYQDGEALSAHSDSEHYTAALSGLMDCLVQPPRLALFDEVDGEADAAAAARER